MNSALETDINLPSVKSEYMIEGYIPTVEDTYLKAFCFPKWVTYGMKRHRVPVTDSSESSREKQNRFEPDAGCGKEGSGPLFANSLLQSIIVVTISN